MTQLQPPKLGTPKDAKINYCLHETGSLLVGDMFLSGYFGECIRMVEELGPIHKLLLAKKGVELSASPENIKNVVARADDTIGWAKQMREEGYHRVNALCFLSEWAAQEAGNENVIAAIVGTIKASGEVAAAKFPNGRFNTAVWPWSDEKCLEIAQKLDQKAKDKTPDGGWNAAGRLVVLFGWLGVSVDIKQQASEKYNEASMVRNVIVHRYGRLSSADASRAPHLLEWIGKTIPMTRDRIREYHDAIIAMHLAISQGIWAKGWK